MSGMKEGKKKKHWGCLVAYLEARIKSQRGAEDLACQEEPSWWGQAAWSWRDRRRRKRSEHGARILDSHSCMLASGIGNAQGKAIAVFEMQGKSLRRNFSHAGREISLSLIDGGQKDLARFKHSLNMRTQIEMSKSKMIHRSKMWVTGRAGRSWENNKILAFILTHQLSPVLIQAWPFAARSWLRLV